jgi:hypothetical protein
MKKLLIGLAGAFTLLASPAMAETQPSTRSLETIVNEVVAEAQTESYEKRTVTVATDAPEGIVYKTLRGADAIQAVSLEGQPGVSCGVSACMNTFKRNPAFLVGAEICISNTELEWALEKDGTQSRDPNRKPVCAVIATDGSFSITANLRINATPYIRKEMLFVGWVDRKSLNGMTDFVSFE